jgi:hypothetical protein
MAKYLTKLIVAGEVGEVAQTYPRDVEANSAEAAAHDCAEHWNKTWIGTKPTTETVIHVHKYSSDGIALETPTAFALYVRWPKLVAPRN